MTTPCAVAGAAAAATPLPVPLPVPRPTLLSPALQMAPASPGSTLWTRCAAYIRPTCLRAERVAAQAAVCLLQPIPRLGPDELGPFCDSACF